MLILTVSYFFFLLSFYVFNFYSSLYFEPHRLIHGIVMGVAYVCTSTSGIDQMLVSHFFIGKQIMLKVTFSTTYIERTWSRF